MVSSNFLSARSSGPTLFYRPPLASRRSQRRCPACCDQDQRWYSSFPAVSRVSCPTHPSQVMQSSGARSPAKKTRKQLRPPKISRRRHILLAVTRVAAGAVVVEEAVPAEEAQTHAGAALREVDMQARMATLLVPMLPQHPPRVGVTPFPSPKANRTSSPKMSLTRSMMLAGQPSRTLLLLLHIGLT